MPVENAGQGIAEIAQKMPPICNLDCVRGDDLDAGMGFQPGGDGLPVAIKSAGGISSM